MIDQHQPDYSNTPVSPYRATYNYLLDNPSTKPVVSLVTPFFNVGDEFYETAYSIFNQSLQQWEWLIINDGSTKPESLKILELYKFIDPRVRVIDHPINKGVSAARNSGFKEAQTKYIVQIDADDLLEPTAIEKWLWFLQSYPEFSMVNGYSVGFGYKEYLWRCGFQNYEQNLFENRIDHTGMVRKQAFVDVGGFDESIRKGGEDWDFWLHCAVKNHWGAAIPEFLNWYRTRETPYDRWDNFTTEGIIQFKNQLQVKYSELLQGNFPRPILNRKHRLPHSEVDHEVSNLLKKDQPRLLLILPWLVLGGADKFNINLIEQFTLKGWEISIITTKSSDNEWLVNFTQLTPDVFILENFLRYENYPVFIKYFIQSRNFSHVLISNSEYGYDLLPYLRAQFPTVTFVDYNHAVDPFWDIGGYPGFGKKYQPFIDLNIVASKQVKDWMVERGAESEKIEICTINIDTELWKPDQDQRKKTRQELKLAENIPVILYAARIYDVKQPLVLARTVNQLSKASLDFKVCIVGDGPDYQELKDYLSANELSDRVILLGALANTRVRELMQAADIFFLPSKSEGIALSIYEAMACGLAIVSSDVGGQKELVSSECGFLIQRSDPDSEVETYTQILSALVQNPQATRSLGMAGRERILNNFRLEQMGDLMSELLARATELHRYRNQPTVVAFGETTASLVTDKLCLVDGLNEVWAHKQGLVDRIQFLEANQPSFRQYLINYLYRDNGYKQKFILPILVWFWRGYQKLKRISGHADQGR